MDFNELVLKRRSIRKFKNQAVDLKDIEEIVKVASLSPSWKNSQVTRYYAILNKDKRKKIALSMPEFNQQACLEAPCLVVVSCITRRSGFNRDGSYATSKKDGWQMYDAGLSNMLFTLEATRRNLSTVIMGYYDEKTIIEEIDLPENQEVICVIALGYANEDVEMPKRKKCEELLVKIL